MYMKITRKRLNKIRKMKKQSARKNKKNRQKHKRRTLRSRKLNLKKRTIRIHKKGGDPIQKAINELNQRIKFLKKSEVYIKKQLQKDRKNALEKRKQFLDNGSKTMKDLTTSQKGQLQIMLNKVKGHKKQLDNIPVQIQQLELQIQNIKRGAMNAQLISTVKKAKEMSDSQIKKMKSSQPTNKSVASDFHSGEVHPKIITTMIRTLKSNKGKILSPGYIVDVIQDPDGVSASTGTTILSQASSRVKPLRPSIKFSSAPIPSTPPIELGMSQSKKSLKQRIQKRKEIQASKTKPVESKFNFNMAKKKQVVQGKKKKQVVPAKKKTQVVPAKKKTQVVPAKKKTQVVQAKKTQKMINNEKMLMKIIKPFQQKKLMIILNKLGVSKKTGDAKKLKETLIERYNNLNRDQMYNFISKFNKTKELNVKKNMSKLQILLLFIKLIRKKSHQQIKQMNNKKTVKKSVKKSTKNTVKKTKKKPSVISNKKPNSSAEKLRNLIKTFQQKKLMIILNKLGVSKKSGDATALKAAIINRYNFINKEQLFKYLKNFNSLKNFSINKNSSKIEMISSFINLIKNKTHKQIQEMHTQAKKKQTDIPKQKPNKKVVKKKNKTVKKGAKKKIKKSSKKNKPIRV